LKGVRPAAPLEQAGRCAGPSLPLRAMRASPLAICRRPLGTTSRCPAWSALRFRNRVIAALLAGRSPSADRAAAGQQRVNGRSGYSRNRGCAGDAGNGSLAGKAPIDRKQREVLIRVRIPVAVLRNPLVQAGFRMCGAAVGQSTGQCAEISARISSRDVAARPEPQGAPRAAGPRCSEFTPASPGRSGRQPASTETLENRPTRLSRPG
jgi:hypothetical protein